MTMTHLCGTIRARRISADFGHLTNSHIAICFCNKTEKSITSPHVLLSSSSDSQASAPCATDGEQRGPPRAPTISPVDVRRLGHTYSGHPCVATVFVTPANVKSFRVIPLPTTPIVKSMLVFVVTWPMVSRSALISAWTTWVQNQIYCQITSANIVDAMPF